MLFFMGIELYCGNIECSRGSNPLDSGEKAFYDGREDVFCSMGCSRKVLGSGTIGLDKNWLNTMVDRILESRKRRLQEGFVPSEQDAFFRYVE